jgi:hypothetical protein
LVPSPAPPMAGHTFHGEAALQIISEKCSNSKLYFTFFLFFIFMMMINVTRQWFGFIGIYD